MDEIGPDKFSEMQRACLRLVAQLKKTQQIAADWFRDPRQAKVV